MRAGGSDDAGGEAGFSAYERTTLRPALTITGVSGGYTGPGAQSAVPASAQARLNLRLVPDQDPREVRRLVCARLRSLAPEGLDLVVRSGPGSRATTIDRRSTAIVAAARALGEAFGRRPAFVRSGGTIPIVDVMQRLFDVPVVLMGFALPGDGMHAPNERVNLPTLHRGTLACARFLELAASSVAARGEAA
jgi:acetylornithine deacetylase/succinyl-diaminopimelate desuccinylase-like protein